jgi:hypothetical protein
MKITFERLYEALQSIFNAIKMTPLRPEIGLETRSTSEHNVRQGAPYLVKATKSGAPYLDFEMWAFARKAQTAFFQSADTTRVPHP